MQENFVENSGPPEFGQGGLKLTHNQNENHGIKDFTTWPGNNFKQLVTAIKYKFKCVKYLEEREQMSFDCTSVSKIKGCQSVGKMLRNMLIHTLFYV